MSLRSFTDAYTADSWNAGLEAAKAYKRMYGVGPINLGGGPHGSKVRGDAETEAWESFRPTLEHRGLNERDMASARQNFMHAYYQEMDKGTYQERNPSTSDMEDLAFDAGKEWGMTGSWSSGVSNANVRRYGFVKWWNNTSPAETKGVRKSAVERAFYEGYKIGREKANQGFRERAKGRRNPGGGRFGSDESDLTGSVIEYEDPMTGDGRIMHSTVVYHGPSTVRTRSGETIRLRDIVRVWDKAAYVRIFGKVPEGPITGRKSNPESSAPLYRYYVEWSSPTGSGNDVFVTGETIRHKVIREYEDRFRVKVDKLETAGVYDDDASYFRSKRNPTSSTKAQRMAKDILARVKRAGGIYPSVLKNIGGGYDLFVYKLNSLHRDWRTHQFGVDLTAAGQKIESRVYRDEAELVQGLTHAIMTKELGGVDHLGRENNPTSDWPGANSVYRKIQGFLNWYALQQNYRNRYGAKGRQIGPGYSITQDHQEMVEELNRGNEEELKRRLQWIRTFYPNYPLDSKRNPESSAADLYESFHGKPSEELLEIGEEVHYHENLAGLGTLTEIKVDCFSGYSAELKFDRDTQLCSNEEGTQLYIVGGDQSLDLQSLKFKADEIDKDQVAIGVITEITYNTQKGFHNFKPTDYYHELGEESGYQPILTYDTRSQLLTIAGGAYKIKPEGIVN